MDLKEQYNDYWKTKPYGIEQARIKEVCDEFKGWSKVLDIGCGKGEIAHALQAQGVDVVGIDFSEVAAARARRDGVEVLTLDFEKELLPFADAHFDGVLFTQTAEHVYDFRPVMNEISRVLKPNGRLIFSIPNIAHWRFRTWLLLGDFPYIEDSQTHWQHLRFFTVKSTRRLLDEFGFAPVKTEGTAGLFSPIYPGFFKKRAVNRIYSRLSRMYPALFAFHVTFVCRKKEAATADGDRLAAGDRLKSVPDRGKAPALPERADMPLKWWRYNRGRDRAFGYPKRIYIESTNRCNLACKMCPNGLGLLDRQKGDMDPALFDGIISELKGRTKTMVMHIWGEPLLNKNLPAMLEKAAGAGFKTEISTNATLLDPEASKVLIESGLNTIYLCLDGASKSTYEAVRRRADFDRTSENIRAFLALKKDRPFVNLQIISMKETEAEIAAFRQKWSVPGVDRINVKAFDTWAGQVEEISVLDSKADGGRVHERWACPLLWYHAHVYWDGTLVSCDRDFNAVRPLGSVRESGVVGAWNGPPMRELRRRHAGGDLAGTPVCADCTEWGWWRPTPFRSWGNAPSTGT